MGWLWSSEAPKSDSATHPKQETTPNAAPPPPPSEPSPPSATKAPSRDELADREFNALLQEIEADLKPSSTKYNRVPKQPPTASESRAAASATSTEGRPLTLEEQLLPTSMSCRQTFDNAFYCQSFGGQFNSLYRYGGMRDCSELWGDFWFCMKTRSYTGPTKDAMIRDRYKRKSLKYKVGPSSEDIWESRTERVEQGEAFSEAFVEQLGSDEEWNRREAERRAGKVVGTTS